MTHHQISKLVSRETPGKCQCPMKFLGVYFEHIPKYRDPMHPRLKAISVWLCLACDIIEETTLSKTKKGRWDSIHRYKYIEALTRGRS